MRTYKYELKTHRFLKARVTSLKKMLFPKQPEKVESFDNGGLNIIKTSLNP